MENILVTGGAGYIGNTICHALREAGYNPVILDSLVAGPRAFTRGFDFYEGDIANGEIVGRILKERPFKTVIHCAARVVVPQSVSNPALYYTENVAKSTAFFSTLVTLGVSRVVFSSSASIYNSATVAQVDESSALGPQSPYARSKWMMEEILRDFSAAYGLEAICLRYFNPIGADFKNRCGPYLQEPSHILGQLVQVYEGKKPTFLITGTQWPTRDGTGVRDYVHVWDLALAHILAIQVHLSKPFHALNLGGGNGTTVREFVQAFEKVTGRPLNVKEAPPRPGDTAGCYALFRRAQDILGWKPQFSIEKGIESALSWQNHKNKIMI